MRLTGKIEREQRKSGESLGVERGFCFEMNKKNQLTAFILTHPNRFNPNPCHQSLSPISKACRPTLLCCLFSCYFCTPPITLLHPPPAFIFFLFCLFFHAFVILITFYLTASYIFYLTASYII